MPARMKLSTAITRLLGIDHPVLLAPMGGVSGGAYSQPRLTAKVLSGFWTLLLLAPSGSTSNQ